MVESDGQVLTGRNVGVAEVISTARQLLVIPSEVERAAKSCDEPEVLGAPLPLQLSKTPLAASISMNKSPPW